MLTGSLLYRVTLSVLVIFFITCKQGDKKQSHKTGDSDTCAAKRSSDHILHFQADTSTADFHAMLNYLLRKGEVSIDKERSDTVADNRDDTTVVLTKILCNEPSINSPEERWYLKGIFGMGADLKLRPGIEEKKDLYDKLFIIQYNFATEEEMEQVYKKMQEIGWGNPHAKWNEYEIVAGKKRIYLTYTATASATSFQRRYTNIIKNEWAGKY